MRTYRRKLEKIVYEETKDMTREDSISKKDASYCTNTHSCALRQMIVRAVMLMKLKNQIIIQIMLYGEDDSKLCPASGCIKLLYLSLVSK
mmetsp:Transcript_16300/g.18900  ORF Transcript_16300/g.18900 Transcript_16300/m.18900 type:complete len:90 (+) Transcript_16300:1762-2031(+)